jgi:Tfp pilus assembly protein PilF
MASKAASETIIVAAAVVIVCAGCAQPMLHFPSTADQLDLFGLMETGRPSSGRLDTGELSRRETAKACLETASRLEAAGHDREAVLLYEKARRNDPGLKQIAHRLAVLYDRRGDADKAKGEFELALQHAGNDTAVWSDYGFFHFQQGNFDAAETALKKACELDPSDQRATVNLAMLYARTDREHESMKLFTDAVGEAAAHSNVGVILAKQGQTERAKKHFEQALAGDPEMPQARAFLTHLAKVEQDSTTARAPDGE